MAINWPKMFYNVYRRVFATINAMLFSFSSRRVSAWFTTVPRDHGFIYWKLDWRVSQNKIFKRWKLHEPAIGAYLIERVKKGARRSTHIPDSSSGSSAELCAPIEFQVLRKTKNCRAIETNYFPERTATRIKTRRTSVSSGPSKEVDQQRWKEPRRLLLLLRREKFKETKFSPRRSEPRAAKQQRKGCASYLDIPMGPLPYPSCRISRRRLAGNINRLRTCGRGFSMKKTMRDAETPPCKFYGGPRDLCS